MANAPPQETEKQSGQDLERPIKDWFEDIQCLNCRSECDITVLLGPVGGTVVDKYSKRLSSQKGLEVRLSRSPTILVVDDNSLTPDLLTPSD